MYLEFENENIFEFHCQPSQTWCPQQGPLPSRVEPQEHSRLLGSLTLVDDERLALLNSAIEARSHAPEMTQHGKQEPRGFDRRKQTLE